MKRKIIIIPLVVIIALSSYYYNHLQRPDKLTIGLFAGNPWSDANFNIYDVIDKLKATYQDKYDIEVEYVSGILKEDYSNYLNSLIVAGKEPDIYLVFEEDFASLASINALCPLDDMIAQDQSFDLESYYQAPLKAGEYKNNRYGLPVDCDLDLLFVNETLLEKEGITIEGRLDLEEFYQVCQQATRDTNGDGTVDQFGCCNYDLGDVFDAYGIDFFAQGCFTIDHASTKAAIEYYKKLTALNGRTTLSLDDFDLGKVAFAKLPFSQFRTYRFYPYNLTRYSTFKWDCINLPANGVDSGGCSALLMGISSRCQDKLAAFKFVRMLSYDSCFQQDYFATSQGISPLVSVVNSKATKDLLSGQSLDVDFDLAVIDRGMEEAATSQNISGYNDLYDQALLKLSGALTTDQDIDLYLIDVQKQMEQLMIQATK